jgi:GTP pyrophosphokinase
METVQLCPPEIRSRIANVRAALEETGRVTLGALDTAAEAAEIIGALTDDAELASAVCVQPAFGQADLAPEAVEKLIGSVGARIALDLSRLGDLGLPHGWSPARGVHGRQAETLRKMLLAVVSDPRIVLARLAEHLVKLRHARALEASERERIAIEARAVFAPLANRLGVWQLKWELEDLAFRYLEPEDYRLIAAALNEKRADRERYIESLCVILRSELAQVNVAAEVYGRPKHIYSIFRKMQRKHLAFDQLFDVRAVRIVAESVPDCYAALGLVHSRWPYIAGEFDDYIATPKENFYRSIHTAVVGPENKSVEVQIRTREMHEHAELGVAAHWQYKEGGARDAQYERKIEAVRRMLKPEESQDADKDFLERIRAQIFEDRIYALTPKGEVVDLPSGATPLDFAYHLHTDLGHRCRGAKVNGRIVPLTYALHNGEVVEIITTKVPAPSRDWMAAEQGYLVSGRNRAKVRAWFRKQAEETAGVEIAAATPVAPEPVQRPEPPPILPRRKPQKTSGRRRTPVDIEGVGDLPVTLARCCTPIRPNPITGYVSLGRGVTIHRSDCPSLLRMRDEKPERTLQVEWAVDDTDLLPVEIAVSAYDRRGLVRDLTEIVAQEKISIEGMNTATDPDTAIARMVLRLSVRDNDQLVHLLARLSRVPNVFDTRRVS